MKSENEKAHLLYLTGLSVDKQRMNNITENINFDKDFTYWLDKTQKKFNAIVSPQNQKLQKGESLTRYGLKKVLTFGTDDLVDIGSSILGTVVEDELNDKIDEKAENSIDRVIKPVSSFVFKIFGLEDDECIKNNHNFLYQIIQKMKDKYTNYHNGDFFSLYLANQSDSIGLIPLATIADDKKFNIEHAYADWDYYDNKYIDHIVLKVKKSSFKEEIDYEQELEKTFSMHFYDILLSKLIKDSQIEINKNMSEPKELKSLIDLALKSNDKYSKSDLLDMLSERNFFGIALLSQILYTISLITNKKDQIINLDNESNEKEFLQELLEMSSNPSNIFSQNNIDASISARLYFSDGVKLVNSQIKNNDIELSQTLLKDDYFYNMFMELKDTSYDDNEKLNLIENKYIRTVDYDANKNHSLYITTDEKKEYVYIKVPIKMMLSLPIDSEKNPSNTLYLPGCLTPLNDTTVDVLTVGGAEHNRGLAHLINKHRLEKREDRLFGFMDNYFDFEYKLEIDTKDSKYKHNFFMGLNQPVSGWNYYLAQRHNDDEGYSVNGSIKYLHFKLKDKDRQINIVSIYGFSAISSVLAIHMFIAELLSKDRTKGGAMFEGNFSEFFQKQKLDKNEDCTQAIFLKKNAEETKQEIIYEKFNGLCYLRQFNIDKKLYKTVLFDEKSELIKDITDGRVTTS